MSKRGCLAGTMRTLRPPPELSLSEWSKAFFVLSSETAAQPGRCTPLAWQREVMDAVTDETVERVTVMKSSRVGYTTLLSTVIGYHMAHDPTTIMVCQPTVDDAKGFSKEVVGPMLRDVPVLAALNVRDEEQDEDASSTLLHRTFPGGILSLVGANSGTGFRRVSRRIILLDEVDAYPSSAGQDGDPVKLAERRSEHFWDRRIVCGSTPLVAGASRIEELFLAGDQRRYHVPCPHCGHFDFLVFETKGDRGHIMRWPDAKPELAYFECRACGCSIEETHKREILEAGEWRADNPGGSHRSYHLWSSLSTSPNASWGQIAAEFLEAKKRPETLRTFVNTVLGETWKERGEAPDWERLYLRREDYAIGSMPAGALFLTAGVDVQKDRFVYEVVAWAPRKESWSVDAGELYGDTARDETWHQLDALLEREFSGGLDTHKISMLAVDSGYQTQLVYAWARQHPMNRVIATKGVAGARALIGTPSPVDVTVSGRRLQRGYKVWSVGVDLAKAEFYAWLRLRIAEDGEVPAGYCHFPMAYGEEFFRQVTSEHLVTTTNKRTNRATQIWCVQPGRENHHLDARLLARVAAAVLGIDRLNARQQQARQHVVTQQQQQQQQQQPQQPQSDGAPTASDYWAGTRRRDFWKGWRR